RRTHILAEIMSNLVRLGQQGYSAIAFDQLQGIQRPQRMRLRFPRSQFVVQGRQLFCRDSFNPTQENVAFTDGLVDSTPRLSVHVRVVSGRKRVSIPKGWKRSLEDPLRTLGFVRQCRAVDIREYPRIVTGVQVTPYPILSREQFVQ